MQPRVDVVALSDRATARDVLQLAISTKYSRIPICRNGNIDDVVGIVFAKDLLDLLLAKPTTNNTSSTGDGNKNEKMQMLSVGLVVQSLLLK